MSERSMTKWSSLSLLALALSVMFSAAAFADPVGDADSVNDAFYKASAACDIPAVLNLYEDNAIVIWPGQGEYAVGKPAFQKILKTYCSGGVKQSFKVVSSDARPVGKDYIIHFGQLEVTTQGPDGKSITLRVRTDELLHQSGGKWRYEIDHASVGLPPPGGATRDTPNHQSK
jgi:uncharacterized protein (TIGR02246 family)